MSRLSLRTLSYAVDAVAKSNDKMVGRGQWPLAVKKCLPRKVDAYGLIWLWQKCFVHLAGDGDMQITFAKGTQNISKRYNVLSRSTRLSCLTADWQLMVSYGSGKSRAQLVRCFWIRSFGKTFSNVRRAVRHLNAFGSLEKLGNSAIFKREISIHRMAIIWSYIGSKR